MRGRGRGRGTVVWCDAQGKEVDFWAGPLRERGLDFQALTTPEAAVDLITHGPTDARLLAFVTSMMVSRGRREMGEMSGFEAFAAIREALAETGQRPLCVLVSGSGCSKEAYQRGADIAVCHDNDQLAKSRKHRGA